MFVRDVMTYNVVTIPSDTPIMEAERILEFHKFERLPVVDKGKLVGIVTKDDLLKATPSTATSFSRGEIHYLIMKLTVKEIMKKKVVTVSPDTTIERAAAIAQKHRVGCLPVVEGERLVGMTTTNDVFYKIINPLFGIGESGKRIIVYGAGEVEEMQKVLDRVGKAGLKIKTLWVPSGLERKELVLHFEASDVTQLVSDLIQAGFSAEEREFTP